MVLARFEETQERAKINVYTPIFEVTEQAAVKTFFAGGAEGLPDDKMYKPSESQYFTKGLVRHLIKSSIISMPLTSFLRQFVKEAVASEGIFRQDVSWETPIKKKTTALSSLTGFSTKLSKTSKDDQGNRRKRNLLHTITPNPHFVWSKAQADTHLTTKSAKMMRSQEE